MTPADALTVTRVNEFPASVSAQSSYSVRLRVLAALQPVSDVRLTLSVTDAPLKDSDALAQFLADPSVVERHRVAATAVGTTDTTGRTVLSAHTETAVNATVEAGGFGLDPDTPGVYGMVVELRTPTGTVWQAATPVTWQPRALPNLDVAVVATIAGNPARTSALLSAADDDRITLAVDTANLDAEQLASLTRREAFAVPAGNLDISSAAHVFAASLLDEALASARGSVELPWLAFAAAVDDSTMTLASQGGALAVLSTGPTTLDVPFPVVTATEIVDRAGEPLTPAPVVLIHSRISRALAGLVPGDPTTTSRVYAEAAFASMSGAGTVVVAPGADWLVDGSHPAHAVTSLLDAPFVTPRTLAGLLSGPSRTEVDLPEATPSEVDIPGGQIVAAVSALSALANVDAASDSVSTLTQRARQEVFSSMSLADRDDPARRSGRIDDAVANANDLATSVRVISGTDLTLVSHSGAVPLTIHNGLDVPVTVQVAMTSRSLILQAKAAPLVTIEPYSDAMVTVPVEAVSSGDVNVSVALRNADGATLSVAETLRVRVRAAWGSAATGVVTGALVLLLLAGIYRTIRRGRRDTRLVPTASTPVAGESESDDD